MRPSRRVSELVLFTMLLSARTTHPRIVLQWLRAQRSAVAAASQHAHHRSTTAQILAPQQHARRRFSAENLSQSDLDEVQWARVQDPGAEDLLQLWAKLTVAQQYAEMVKWSKRTGSTQVSVVVTPSDSLARLGFGL